MKKILSITLVLLLCLGVVGCTTQETVEPAQTGTGTVATTTEKPEPTKNENLREYNKVLVDNENLRAELLSIEYMYDDIFDQEVKENVIVIDGGYNKINGEVVGCVSKRIKSISSMYTKEIGGINNLVIPYLLDNLYRIKNIKRV